MAALSDRQALIAAIIEHPEEDTPRLAFADWLDERGDAYFADWAALIRSQVEAARTERFSPRWVELVRDQQALFTKRKKEWDINWDCRLGRCPFRRGFREGVALELKDFASRAPMAFDANPVRALRLFDLAAARRRSAFPDVIEFPGLERVETLDVANNPAAAVRELLDLASPRLPRLRALGVGRSHLIAGEVGDLLANPAFGRLDALDLHENPLFLESRPESLFHAPALARVRWLDLSDTGLTAAALSVLAHAPRTTGLRVLRIGRNRYDPAAPSLDPPGIEVLANGPAFRGIEYLDLTGQPLGPRELAALLGSPTFPAVRELHLRLCGVGDEEVEVLATSPAVRGLRVLDLGYNRVTDRGARAALDSPNLSALGLLALEWNAELSDDVRSRLTERFPGYYRDWVRPAAGLYEPIP
ncbi:MAG TPA: TIGR02996 domain-containing protein [Gemmataceae bacterium]|nr:TIGR02996 domain-containing protein [Gemmataceae bacterium]